MRLKTDGQYPKYIIWENVAGLFQAIKEKIFAGSWKKSQKVIFQCLQVEDGSNSEWLELRAGGLA